MSALATGHAPSVLGRLADLSRERGPEGMEARLQELRRLTATDLAECEAVLATLPHGPSRVRQAAGHLLDRGGKRLRPLCVALAARVGSGYGEAARELAIAVELVHAATLLHDDVVDMGERRRGAPASRMLFGNTASIFAGDYLLIEAMRRVERARVEGAFERLLDVIDEMIEAESVQLEHRGRLDLDRPTWQRVVEGKTAALFRWAMYAGGRAGGLESRQCAGLERYGLHLGVAFQVVDDVLDFTGDEGATGKSVLADLHEGKLTYPILIGLERDPTLRAPLGAIAEASQRGEVPPREQVAAVAGALHACGALDAGRALAREQVRLAVEALAPLPQGPATHALIAVADASLGRDR